MSRLPYDPFRLDQRPYIYNDREWKYKTRDLKIHRDLEEIVFDVSLMLANEISDHADANILRTFYYNMMSKDDFQNQNFDRLVMFTCDYIELRLEVREIRRPDGDLKTSVENALLMHMSKQVRDFEELERELREDRNPQLLRSAEQNIGMLNRALEQIEDMHKNVDSHRGSGRDDRDSRSRDDRFERGGRSSRGSSNYDREERYGRQDNRGSSRGTSYSRGSREYGNDGRGRDDRDDRGYSRGGRDDRYGRNTSNNIYGDRDADSARDIPEEQVPEVVENASRARTSSSALPRMSDHVSRVTEQTEPVRRETTQDPKKVVEEAAKALTEYFKAFGGEIPILSPTNGKTEMNMNQHAAVYPGVDDHGIDLTEQMLKFISLAEAITAGNVTPEQISHAVEVETDVSMASTVRELARVVTEKAVLANIDASGENTDGVRKIRHEQGIVSNDIVGCALLKDLQTGIANVKSSVELQEILKRAVITMANGTSPDAAYASDIRAAVDHIDEVMTLEINSYCRDVLKIADGEAIQSFMLDFMDLMDAVHRSGKTDISNALSIFISNLMGNIQECLDPTAGIGDLVAETRELPENAAFAFLPQSYLVTFIPFTMKELGYKINKPTVISGEQLTPFLAAALNIDEEITGNNFEMKMRLLTTRDNKVFRAHRYPNRKNVWVLVPVAA